MDFVFFFQGEKIPLMISWNYIFCTRQNSLVCVFLFAINITMHALCVYNVWIYVQHTYIYLHSWPSAINLLLISVFKALLYGMRFYVDTATQVGLVSCVSEWNDELLLICFCLGFFYSFVCSHPFPTKTKPNTKIEPEKNRKSNIIREQRQFSEKKLTQTHI